MNFSELYIIFLILSAIIGGIINLYQLINFIKQSKLRFLSSRNPPLIIMYCIISLTTAFTTTPLNLYYQGLQPDAPFFAPFTTELFHEFCTVMLLVIILCRSWLLYYDYRFSESSSDEIWRNIVDSNEDNFWRRNRKTFGNLHFIICVSLIIDSLSLLCLSFIGSIVLRVQNSSIFHFFSLYICGIPFYLVIIYLIMYKIQSLNDIYLIQKEIKYLSICIIIRILAFSIDLLLLKEYDNFLFFNTVEVVTTFLSVWIQCWWVLNNLKRTETEKENALYFDFSKIDKPEIKKQKHSFLKMVDIFEEKMSFKTFIRHCTHELSVESILFLIEIAQFKATLNKFNAFGINELNFRFIDVNTSKFVKYIKQKRRARIDKQLIIHPAPSSTSNLGNTLVSSGSASDDPEPSDHQTPPPNVIISPSTSPRLNTKLIPVPLTSVSSILSQSHTTALKNKEVVASTRQESEYKQFQQTVLQKKWLPIAQPLSPATNCRDIRKLYGLSSTNSNEKSKTKSGTTSGTGTGEKTRSKTHSKTPKLHDKSKLRDNVFIAPISLAVIEDSTYSNIDENNKTNNLTVDINWMYEYGRHLYLKYVDNSADLAINISHEIRKNLWNIFSKELTEEAFQTIQLIHHEDLTAMSRLNPKEQQLFIQTYLYHSFDLAFHAVWGLLKSDTFYRFQKTKQYKMLCKQLDIEKLQNDRNIRDREYSQSYQD